MLGAAVLFASYKINSRIDSRDFTIFIWAGYLFLIISAAKLSIWFIHRRKESHIDKREINSYDYQKKRVVKYCPNCGNPLHGHENFCSSCGKKLR